MKLHSIHELRAAAWIYVFVGTYALIEQTVSLFLPVEHPLMWGYFLLPRVNLVIVALPIGVGLLRGGDIYRKLAVGLNWLVAGFIGLLLVFFLIGALTGSVAWKASEHSATGDEVARMIALVVVGLPLFTWQFRVLRSEGIRRLTQPTSGGVS
jgi:hypothetical protein